MSENLDLMAQLAQADTQSRTRESTSAVSEVVTSNKEDTNDVRRSKTPVQTNARPHKPTAEEWAALEQAHTEVFTLENQNRQLRRLVEVELANEVYSTTYCLTKRHIISHSLYYVDCIIADIFTSIPT